MLHCLSFFGLFGQRETWLCLKVHHSLLKESKFILFALCLELVVSRIQIALFVRTLLYNHITLKGFSSFLLGYGSFTWRFLFAWFDLWALCILLIYSFLWMNFFCPLAIKLKKKKKFLAIVTLYLFQVISLWSYHSQSGHYSSEEWPMFIWRKLTRVKHILLH